MVCAQAKGLVTDHAAWDVLTRPWEQAADYKPLVPGAGWLNAELWELSYEGVALGTPSTLCVHWTRLPDAQAMQGPDDSGALASCIRLTQEVNANSLSESTASFMNANFL